MDKNIDLGNINIMVVTEIIGVEEISLRHFIINFFFFFKKERSKMTCKASTLKMQRGIKYIKETEEHPEKKEDNHKKMLLRKPGI